MNKIIFPDCFFHLRIKQRIPASPMVLGKYASTIQSNPFCPFHFYNEIKKAEGKPVGKSRLARVTHGSGLPTETVSAVYLGSPGKLSEVIDYTATHKIISITGLTELVPKGITLGIGVYDNKPKVLLNLTSSEAEGVDWNPMILKISKTYK